MLSEEDRRRFEEAFCYFDKEGDGMIPAKEVVLAMRSAGENLLEDEAAEMLKGAAHGVDMQTFMKIAEQQVNEGKGRNVEEELGKAFRFFDRNQTGAVYIGELRHLLTSVGEKLSGDEFDSWIGDRDCDSNGRLTFDALVKKLVASHS